MISLGAAILFWASVWALWVLLVRPVYRFAVSVRKDRKAVTAAFECTHDEWVEVLSVEHELVAYLCLNKSCNETLYADEWSPKGCLCKPAEKRFCIHCSVKNHSGWAVLLDTKIAKCEECNPAPVPAGHDYQCVCTSCYEKRLAMLWEHVSLSPGESIVTSSTYGRAKGGVVRITDKDFSVYQHYQDGFVYHEFVHRDEIIRKAKRLAAETRAIQKQNEKTMKYLHNGQGKRF